VTIIWSDHWESRGCPPGVDIRGPCVQHNQDGRLEIFVLGLGGLFTLSQITANDGWPEFNPWLAIDPPSTSVSIKSFVIGRNQDGRQEIFGLGTDNALWQQWQTSPNGEWSQWRTLRTPAADVSITDKFTVGRNQDGRQEVFALAGDGNIWQIWQTAPNNGWSNWRNLGQPVAGIRTSDRISVASNRDSRQELFVMGRDDALWHTWQIAPNNGWHDWASLGKPADRHLTQPVAATNADGHLEVFAPGDGAFCNRWQLAPNANQWRTEGWNEKPPPRVTPPVGLTRLEVALNFEDRLEVIGFGDDGALWHAWQQAPAWSEWHSLGSPPVGIDAADTLSIGTNHDGRLEVFLMGNGTVWHIWQTR
jgi:hypothetical protein